MNFERTEIMSCSVRPDSILAYAFKHSCMVSTPSEEFSADLIAIGRERARIRLSANVFGPDKGKDVSLAHGMDARGFLPAYISCKVAEMHKRELWLDFCTPLILPIFDLQLLLEA